MEKCRKIWRVITKFLARPVGKASVVAVAGGFFFWLGHAAKAPDRSVETPRYLVAERGLPAGHPLGVKDMDLKIVGEETVPAGAYTDKKLHWVLGRRLLTDVSAGDWIREETLEGEGHSLSRRVPDGFRAYSLIVESRLPVAAGDRVDIVFRSDTAGEIPVTLMEGAEILDADLDQEKLVLAVRPNEVPLLEKARQSGKLTVALHGSREGMTRGKRNTHFQKRKAKRQVQLWSEGE